MMEPDDGRRNEKYRVSERKRSREKPWLRVCLRRTCPMGSAYAGHRARYGFLCIPNFAEFIESERISTGYLLPHDSSRFDRFPVHLPSPRRWQGAGQLLQLLV